MINKEEIKFQIKNEIEMGLNYIRDKRNIFRERIVKYIDQNKEEWKIWVNTIYSMINLWIALRLSDEVQVLFSPRNFGDEEYCENLTNLAKFDYEEMGLKQMDYARYWDTEFFGFAIRQKGWWDDNKQCPVVYQKDPLSRIPDPYSDFLTTPRFHYFESEILKSQMTKERGFIPEEVEELTNTKNQEIESNKTYRNEASWFNLINEDISKDFYVNVYDGFTYIDWDLFAVTLSESGELIRCIKIKAVRDIEKKSWYIDIRTQVEVERYSPLRWNPCWVSIVDLIIDKQIANSELMNLRLIDAKFSTFWQTNLVNTDIVTNTWELTRPSISTKWVKVNAGWQSLSNAVYPVPRQSIMQDSFNVTNELSRQTQLDTWISENTLWIAEKNITLGQAQQVQSNANLKIVLWITIANWWEVDFWNYIWLRSYEEYFWKAEKKAIAVTNGFWVNVIEIRKEEFIWWSNPNIIIDSKKKVETQSQKMKANFLAMLPYFTQDPTRPQIVKNTALRYALKLDWMSKEMINILTYDPVEEKAKSLVHLLNANDTKWAIVKDLSEDHLTYLIIFESARDTPAKQLAIENRKRAFILSWQISKQSLPPDGGMINQTQAMNTANAISLNNNWQNN